MRSLVRYALFSLAGGGLADLIYKVPAEGTAFHELCRGAGRLHGAVLHDQNCEWRRSCGQSSPKCAPS